MNYYEIGQRIRRIRRARGFSQEQVAEQVGISVVHMSHIETGNTKLSLPVLVGIATVFGVRADDLLSDNTPYTANDALSELAAELEGCTPQEIKAVTDIAKATCQSFKMHLR